MPIRNLLVILCLLGASAPPVSATAGPTDTCSYTMDYDVTLMAGISPFSAVFDCAEPWTSAKVSVDDLVSPEPCYTIELNGQHQLIVTLWAFSVSSVYGATCLTTQGEVRVTNG